MDNMDPGSGDNPVVAVVRQARLAADRRARGGGYQLRIRTSQQGTPE